MPRILGIDIPRNKKIKIALTYLYGIGNTKALEIIKRANIDPEIRADKLNEEEVSRITSIIQKDFRVEGELRRVVTGNVKRLMDVGCYRGLRHKRGLPSRGQRTASNARTRKGPRRTVGAKRKK
jgi:small subunit ribosomal protein S13